MCRLSNVRVSCQRFPIHSGIRDNSPVSHIFFSHVCGLFWVRNPIDRVQQNCAALWARHKPACTGCGELSRLRRPHVGLGPTRVARQSGQTWYCVDPDFLCPRRCKCVRWRSHIIRILSGKLNQNFKRQMAVLTAYFEPGHMTAMTTRTRTGDVFRLELNRWLGVGRWDAKNEFPTVCNARLSKLFELYINWTNGSGWVDESKGWGWVGCKIFCNSASLSFWAFCERVAHRGLKIACVASFRTKIFL